MKPYPYDDFLPVSRNDMQARGWSQCDFILVSGDAYVDHPSFGVAIISRVLESEGYKVGILAQPDWKDPQAYTRLGRPRLAFLVTAGNMDSMVNRYTANKKPRSEDAFSPGGAQGKRPDRALVAYCNGIRAAFKGVPIVIGGIEASLRRFSHYDYWSDTVKKSILVDTKADLLVYGMGETQIRRIARELAAGKDVKAIRDVPGTVWRTGREGELPPGVEILPRHEDAKNNGETFAKSFMAQAKGSGALSGNAMAEPSEAGWVVQNPPPPPLTPPEFDAIHELPYTRRAHPSYDQDGGVPALSEVKFSIIASRGCFGACSFCALAFHQGRIIQKRTKESIVREATLLVSMPDFKGIIHDVGGPTANFRSPACSKQARSGACRDRQCLYPEPCPNLVPEHREYLSVLEAVSRVAGVKKVFVRSGIRFDYLMLDPDDSFLERLAEFHVSGQLKVAPEHISERVLDAMGKPAAKVYRDFKGRFERVSAKLGKKQYLIPYFISAHPGSSLEDAVELAEFLRDTGFVPDQVQDFYPTPGTVSACMYRTGLDPRTMKPIHVAKGERERARQRALIQFDKPENRSLVIEALREAGREDLIGRGEKCLVR